LITARLGMMQSKQPFASFSIQPVGEWVILAYSKLIVLLIRLAWNNAAVFRDKLSLFYEFLIKSINLAQCFGFFNVLDICY